MPPALHELMQQELQERRREEINGLYVALTRARLQLVVSHTQPYGPGSERSWWQRLESVLQPAELPATAPAAPAEVPEARFEVLPPGPVALPPAPPGGGSGVADPQAAALGRAVHRVLEWVGQPGQGLPRARWAEAATQAAAAFGLPPEAASQVVALAARIADSPECARFFGGPALRWAGNEVPVAGADAQVLRIDRLVQLNEAGVSTWWVLDYKLRHRPEQLAAYRQQLQQYRQAVGLALQGQGDAAAVVRSGFITGTGAFIEA